MNLKESFWIFLRYIVLIILAVPGLYLFYLVFTPLTTYPVYWILNLFYKDVILQNSSFLINNAYLINLIPACIAGSAYYLLLILNLTTPMKSNMRFKSIAFLFSTFLFLNILRIILFTFLFFSGVSYFDVAHKLVWYFGSTLFVIIIWFLNVYIFKIREIPVYTDLLRFYKEAVRKKKRRKR